MPTVATCKYPRNQQRIKTLAAELRDRIAGISRKDEKTANDAPDDTVIPFHPVKTTGASKPKNTALSTSSASPHPMIIPHRPKIRRI